MSKLRRLKIFSYVLPAVVAVFLFSVVGTVLADYFPNVYIGKITTSVYYGGGLNSTDPLSENMDVPMYNDSELTALVHTSYLRTGEAYGGYPGALIETIFSAQRQRTAVCVTTDDLNRVQRVSQTDQPDDIFSTVEATQGAVDQIQQTVDGVYSQVVGQTQLLYNIGNLTMTVNENVGAVGGLVNDVNTNVGLVGGLVQDVNTNVGLVGGLVQALDEHLTYQDGYLMKIWNAISGVSDPGPVSTEETVTPKGKR